MTHPADALWESEQRLDIRPVHTHSELPSSTLAVVIQRCHTFSSFIYFHHFREYFVSKCDNDGGSRRSGQYEFRLIKEIWAYEFRLIKKIWPYQFRLIKEIWPYEFRLIKKIWPYQFRIIKKIWPYEFRLIKEIWPYELPCHISHHL